MKPSYRKPPIVMPGIKMKPKQLYKFVELIFGDSSSAYNAVGVLSKSADKGTVRQMIDDMLPKSVMDAEIAYRLCLIDLEHYLKYLLPYIETDTTGEVLGNVVQLCTQDEVSNPVASEIYEFMVNKGVFISYFFDILSCSKTKDYLKVSVEAFEKKSKELTFLSIQAICLNVKTEDYLDAESTNEKFKFAQRIASGIGLEDNDYLRAANLLVSEVPDTILKIQAALTVADAKNQKLVDAYVNALQERFREKKEESVLNLLVHIAKDLDDMEMYRNCILEACDCDEDKALLLLEGEAFSLWETTKPIIEELGYSGIIEKLENRHKKELNKVEPVKSNERKGVYKESKKIEEDIKDENKEDTNERPDSITNVKEKSVKPKTEREEHGEHMSDKRVTTTYIGCVEYAENNNIRFRNFKPLSQIRSSALYTLTDDDYEYFIPHSEKKNIYVRCRNDSGAAEKLDEFCYNGGLIAVDLAPNDLEDYFTKDNRRSLTGYKVSAEEFIRDGKIRSLNEEGYYRIISKRNIRGDITKDKIIYLDDSFSEIGTEQVYLDLGSFYAGPYQVRFRTIDQEFFVLPEVSQSKVLKGYEYTDARTDTISDFSKGTTWFVLSDKGSDNYCYKDLLEPSELIEEWLKTKSENVDYIAILKKVPDVIRENRKKIISDYIHDSEEIEGLSKAMDSALVENLLRTAETDGRIQPYIKEYIKKHKELILEHPDMVAKSAEIESLRGILDNVQDEADRKDGEIENLKNQLQEKENSSKCEHAVYEAEKVLETLQDEVAELEGRRADLEKEIDYNEFHKNKLEKENNSLEFEFQKNLQNQQSKLVELCFDGFIASKMQKAAAEWDSINDQEQLRHLVEEALSHTKEDMTQEELAEYLVTMIHKVRPRYSRNEILNIAVCMMQNFLTIFVGEPGIGKTSICNIYAEVLGLVPQDVAQNKCSRRYIQVSVERGWTSKRDFIGYYNPLSNRVDQTNTAVYDAMRQLSIEKKIALPEQKRPFVILLDEANLSPMEYYWADFMSLCDDPNGSINLGENNIFEVADTLRFVATANADHTTEQFSPRLLDRAAVINLPRVSSVGVETMGYTASDIKPVTWNTVVKAFIPSTYRFTASQKEIFDATSKLLRAGHIYISPRTEIAIQRYCSAATPLFKDDEYGNAPEIVALDYAIVQRVLPKLVGNGEKFASWLNELIIFCDVSNLERCKQQLVSIKEKGELNMKYYSYFS